MDQSQIEDVLRTLVGYAYPVAEPVGEDGRRFLRRWVVRTAADLPEQAELNVLMQRLVALAKQRLLDAYGPDAEDGSYPGAGLVRVDDRHCVVVIESPTPGHAVGDATAIATWGILRELDEEIGIEDIEGIPKVLWFQMK